MSDDQVQRFVEDALDWADPSVDASRSTPLEKQTAERVAQRVRGVETVIDHLVVPSRTDAGATHDGNAHGNVTARTARCGLLVLAIVLVTASGARADIGVIVLEPVSALGFFTRVGHAATYLSNICPDGSPVRMRLCRPAETGGVVIRSSALSENEDDDWAIVPFEGYLHGFGSPDLALLIGTRGLQTALERNAFVSVFSRAIATTAEGAIPGGQCKAALATRFDRSIDVFSVQTTTADDAAILDGDPGVATLVLIAAIDCHLHQSESRREDIAYVEGLLTLLRRESGGFVRKARGFADAEGE